MKELKMGGGRRSHYDFIFSKTRWPQLLAPFY